MEREARYITAVIVATAALSDVIDTTWAAGMGLKTTDGLEATTKIGFKVAETKDGDYAPLYDGTNALVEITVQLDAARAYPLPDEVFAWRYVKLWAQAAGADVAQSADRTFIVVLKS